VSAATIEPGRPMCSGCIHPRDHPDITHSPLGSPTWCTWTACGHNVAVGQETCTADHPSPWVCSSCRQHQLAPAGAGCNAPDFHHPPNQEGTTTVSDDTTPPAKKAATKKAAAPPPPPAPEPVLSPAQQARVAALKEAGDLLEGMEFGSFDLLEVARFIVGDPIQHDDDGDVLTFTGPTPTTEGDTK
jgi:hypothetical protein